MPRNVNAPLRAAYEVDDSKLYMPAFRTNSKSRTPRAPGRDQLAYKIQSKYTSMPAYSMRPKIVLAPSVDPDAPEDFPGPGAYDMSKY